MRSKTEPMRILANVASGRSGARAAARIEKLVRNRSIPIEVRRVSGAAVGTEVCAMLAGGASHIGVAGGDGSISTAADRMAGGDAILVPIPIGTLNHFARRLGIGRLEAALDALGRGRARAVPVGVLDDRVFLNTATVGLYAEMVQRREQLRPILFKWPAAAVAFLELIARMRRVRVVLQVGGTYLYRDTPLVWVGVGWGTFPRVLEAPDRGESPELEVVIVKARTRRSIALLLLRLVRALLRGRRPFPSAGLEIFHTRQLTIHAAQRVGVTVDGEVGSRGSPLFLSVQDAALLVQLPEDLVPDRSR